MRPLQTSSVPTRSNDIDLLSQYRATCQSRTEEQLVLVNSPAHRGSGKARATIAIKVDGGADSLVEPGKRLMFGQCDVNGLQQQLEHRLRVVADALMPGTRVTARHPRHDQGPEAKRQRRVGRFERGHAAVAQGGLGADDARTWADHDGLPLVERRLDRPFRADRLLLSPVARPGCDVTREEPFASQR